MKTLVIMAAGMGSRFGGLKQIEPVGPHGEIIADYSVYDAKRAGFSKVVFIIRKENEEYFRTHIINKYKGIDIVLAFQELDYIPEDVTLPEGRVKMLGTGHALYCAKDVIEGDFIIINSDDFYGKHSYELASKFFDEEDKDYLSVNYPYIVTASKYGKVKRGVVKEENGIIKSITESEIGEENDKIIARSLQDGYEFEISEDTPVAVNFFGLRENFLHILEEKFDEFIHGGLTLTNEFLLPDILKNGINEGLFQIQSKVSESRWIGMTYKEDLESVKKDFVQNFSDVEASEIMKAEQELIKEGTPITEVQKLCDVHSALFHGLTKEEKIANAEKAVEESLKKKKDPK